MTLQEFINQVLATHKPVGSGQCGELTDLYLQEVLNCYTSYPDAKDYWFNGIPGFSVVTDPQAGDIAVYNAHLGDLPGHIVIYVGNGQVFEQNADPDGALPHIYTRSNTYLLGYLRKDSMTPTTTKLCQDLYGAFTGRQPAQNEIDSWLGRDVALLISALESSPETTAYYAKVQAALKAQPEGAVLAPGNYTVK